MISSYQKLKNLWFAHLYSSDNNYYDYMFTLIFGLRLSIYNVEPEKVVDILVSRERKGMQYDPPFEIDNETI